MAEPLRIDGIVPILSMPFLEGDAVDLDGLRRQVDFLAGRGISWVGFGFGSESFRVTETELDEALACVADHGNGRVGVVAAVRAGSISAALRRIERARESGADAAML